MEAKGRLGLVEEWPEGSPAPNVGSSPTPTPLGSFMVVVVVVIEEEDVGSMLAFIAAAKSDSS